MRKLKLLLLLFAVISFTSCKKDSSNSGTTEESSSYSDDEATDEYPDGTYCADIDYYNPDTGTRSTYTLNVEVEDHEVTVIHWTNGGWLDSSHFSPEELDSDGSCSFTTYDGKQYDIQITGSECSSTDEGQVSSNDYYEKQKITCPECGGKKYNYDDVCDDCKRKAEDKEEHTCKRCGQEDSFMFSSDDLCSDCKRADEDKQRAEEEEEQNNQ
jgi:ribosomal protein L37E